MIEILLVEASDLHAVIWSVSRFGRFLGCKLFGSNFFRARRVEFEPLLDEKFFHFFAAEIQSELFLPFFDELGYVGSLHVWMKILGAYKVWALKVYKSLSKILKFWGFEWKIGQGND